MTQDNLLFATNSLRSSVSSLRKKLSNLKISVEQFDAELEKMSSKFDNLTVQADIYKNKLDRELGREVRRLQKELDTVLKNSGQFTLKPVTSAQDKDIASTISIFEAILRSLTDGAEDFRLLCESFLFPAVYERIVKAEEEAYFLSEIPSSAAIVVARGREYLSLIREDCDTHLISQDAWEKYSPLVCDWWRNDALPLLYSSRDEQWDIDVPLSLQEMLLWRNNSSDRPLNFPKIFDAYEIYRANKDSVYETSGVRKFEMQMFTFTEN